MISLFFHKGTAIWLKFNEILTFLYKRNLAMFPAEIGINSFSYPSRKKGVIQANTYPYSRYTEFQND